MVMGVKCMYTRISFIVIIPTCYISKVLFNNFALQMIFYCSTVDVAHEFSNLRFTTSVVKYFLSSIIMYYRGIVDANTLVLLISIKVEHDEKLYP